MRERERERGREREEARTEVYRKEEKRPRDRRTSDCLAELAMSASDIRQHNRIKTWSKSRNTSLPINYNVIKEQGADEANMVSQSHFTRQYSHSSVAHCLIPANY